MLDILGTVKTVGIKAIGSIKKVSPTVLLVGGTGLVAAGIIFACKKTKDAIEVKEEFLNLRETIDSIEDGQVYSDEDGNEVVYTNKDRRKATAELYLKTGKELAKVYALPCGLIFSGFGLIYTGFGIVKKRNTQLIAASAALADAFKKYKEAVREKLGDEAESDIRFGAVESEVEEEVVETTKDGKEKKKTRKKKIKTFSELANDPYAKCFDESNVNWKNSNVDNKNFLLIAQNWANDLYNARESDTTRGHVFLNEVYDFLGFDHTATGAVCGWVKGVGDNYISFGVEDGVMEANRAFIRGEEPSIWLDFNVDGVILDYIQKK